MAPFTDSESFRNVILSHPRIAISNLYVLYYEALVRIAERKTGDRKASEDIVQEVFVETWKNLKRLDKREGFLMGPYLAGLVKKRAITYHHQSARFFRARSLDEFSGAASKESELIQSDRYNLLRHHVSTILPRRERECIEMRFLREMSIESISISLGISKKSVEKGITKGLKRLRNYKSLFY